MLIPFFWLADTWWYGMTGRASWNDFKVLVADRKKKGFTVIQTVVGVPPEIDIFSKHAANSGGLPFVKSDYSSSGIEKNSINSSRQARTINSNAIKINPKYFIEVDKKIKNLVDNGFVPCIFGAWGHHIDILGVNLIKKWWGEIVKRYAKYPVVWCLTGEVDIFPSVTIYEYGLNKKVFSYLPNYLKRLVLSFRALARNLAKRSDIIKKTLTLDSSVVSLPRNDIVVSNEIKERLKKWDEVARYIKKIDLCKRLLTVHIHSRTTAAKLFNNPAWLDIDSIQSGHSKDSLGFMISSIKEASKNNRRPIINLEPWYEGILGNFGEKEQLQAFWACIEAGAAGHSYGAHGIWQMATKKDNFMGHWGKSDWKKAMNFPGSTTLGHAKKLYIKKVKNPIIV